ncbi:MAG: hypothetical protein IPJ76_15740 [Flavobacteriales bacterium]|nr:MAG: hypothetical protein IPJ76_15740 [Flavobacteriales bacterium]
MRKLLALATLTATGAWACDCYGPQTFCGVQAPPPPFWEYTPPDHNILGVKLGEVSYGMDVLVLQSFSGSIAAGDTIRVWGDCGWLCRRFVDTWADGDTVVWGLHDADLQGNGTCAGAAEQPGDFMITICGLNWLGYANGSVNGQITDGTQQIMTLAEFQTTLGDCLAGTTGMEEQQADGQLLWDGIRQQLAWQGANTPVSIDVTDMNGRTVLSGRWRGEAIRLAGLASEVVIVRVRHAQGILRKRIVVR